MRGELHASLPIGRYTPLGARVVIKPPDIVVGGLRFYHGSFFLFFRQLPSELAERISTKTGHMLRSECNFKIHVRNMGIPVLY